MIARALVLSVLIGLAGAYGSATAGYEAAVSRASLNALPRTLGSWTAVADAPLDAASLTVLRVDDYINRTYAGAERLPVNLYVGYYASQRQGDTIHSPQNCLPGSGWQPVESSRTSLSVDGRTLPINRYVVERSGQRQLAYYWYQGRGRVIANEYANKFWLMADAATLHRSNGALVRVMTPLVDGRGDGQADAVATAFVRELFPQLTRYLP